MSTRLPHTTLASPTTRTTTRDAGRPTSRPTSSAGLPPVRTVSALQIRARPPESWQSAGQPWDFGEDAKEDCYPARVPQFATTAITCGRYFQTVRVPYREAEAAHTLLDPRGPVLANLLAGACHFILDPGVAAADRWDVPGTRLLREGTRIDIPPPFAVSGRDMRWIVLPGNGRNNPRRLSRSLGATSRAGGHGPSRTRQTGGA